MSRPTVITQRVLSELKTAFNMDLTDKEACVFVGISEKTLYNYQSKNPEFLQQKEVWRASPIFKARKAVYERIEGGDAEFALKFLKVKLPHEFGGSSVRRKYEQNNDSDLREVAKRIEQARKS